ncbi:hypothetical protein C8J57DRAFT_1481805 [Mycena rebaudengoi]|nr:hypothetical protein C8J57DRAFT_1481805 [Mycena rebaudengoi]
MFQSLGGTNDSQLGKFWKSLLALIWGGSRKIRGTISIDPSGRLALYWRRYGRSGPKSHLSLLAGCYASEKLAGGHATKSGSDLVKNPCSAGAFFIFVRAQSAMHPINACWHRDKSGKSLLVDVQQNKEGDSAPEVTPEKLAGSVVGSDGRVVETVPCPTFTFSIHLPLYYLTSFVCIANIARSSISHSYHHYRVLCEALCPEVAVEHLTSKVKNLLWPYRITDPIYEPTSQAIPPTTPDVQCLDTGKACWRMYSKIKRVIPMMESGQEDDKREKPGLPWLSHNT